MSSTQVARSKTSRARSGSTRAQGARRTGPASAPPTQTRELVGVGVVAVGAFLAAQLFLGMGVGPLGAWLETGVRYGVGRLVWLAPVLLATAGLLLLLDSPLLAAPPVRTGAAIGVLTACLALAAGSFGLGGESREMWFDGHTMAALGGFVGEALYFITAHLAGGFGTALLVGVGALTAVTMITGASIATLARSSGTATARAGRTVGKGVSTATVHALRSSGSVSRQVRSVVSERDATGGLRRRRSPSRPLVDGADNFPDLFEGDDHLPPSPALGALAHRAPLADPLDEPVADHVDDEDVLVEEPAATRGVIDRSRLTPPPIPRRADEAADPFGDAGEAPADDDDPGADEPHDDHDELPDEDDAPEARRAYRLPPTGILKRTGGPGRVPAEIINETSRRLEETLGHFGITATVSDAVSGPRVTRYELQLAPGTKVGRITALRDDLAYSLAAREELRILAPIPGKQAVGVEVPNPDASLVTLGDIYRKFPEGSSALMAWLGQDIAGKPVYLDIARMPHLLIAGSTGTGKSVCLNSLLASILLHSSPADLRMILIDPKKVELNHYERIPHLLTPVVTNMRDAAAVLANVVREMESRYELMGMARARNLRDWNVAREGEGKPPMPMVLVVIDELADLMMVAPADVEDAIIRLAQKSRAVGIHLLLATQRPSADVITGMIKANVPSRIAFAVSSQVDSRVVLDAGGAETLLGSGDMLFRPVGTSRLQRLQGAYVGEDEVLAITEHWRKQGRPEMREELLERPPDPAKAEPDPEADEMLTRAIEMVVSQGTASVSLLQRRLGVGYARAGRLVDAMEQLGVVSGYEGSKPRTVLIGEHDLPRVLHNAAAEGGADPADDEQLRLPEDEDA